MIIIDGYKIVNANQAFETLSGYNKDEIIGKIEWTKFIDKEDLPRMLEYYRKRKIDPLSVPSEYEFTFIDRRKNKKEVLLIVSPLPNGRFFWHHLWILLKESSWRKS